LLPKKDVLNAIIYIHIHQNTFFEYKKKTSKSKFRSQCKKCHQKQVILSKYKYRYNLEEKDLDHLLTNQENRCSICGNNTKLFVDHNHKNNKFRGLLCSTCNTGLGMFKDSIYNLEKAIKYLKDSNNEFEAARIANED